MMTYFSFFSSFLSAVSASSSLVSSALDSSLPSSALASSFGLAGMIKSLQVKSSNCVCTLVKESLPWFLEKESCRVKTLSQHLQSLGSLSVFSQPRHHRRRHLLQTLQLGLELFNRSQDSSFLIQPVRHCRTFSTEMLKYEESKTQ